MLLKGTDSFSVKITVATNYCLRSRTWFQLREWAKPSRTIPADHPAERRKCVEQGKNKEEEIKYSTPDLT